MRSFTHNVSLDKLRFVRSEKEPESGDEQDGMVQRAVEVSKYYTH